MNDRARILLAVGLTVLLFLGVQLGALALVEPFDASDRQAVENPDDPTNSAIYFAVVLVATGVMLAAFRLDAQWFVRALIVAVSGMLSWYVFAELAARILPGGPTGAVAAAGALAVAAALVVYPEWYVVDLAGVVIGAGAAALFGISFGLLPAILLLAALAIYDAISVYKTGHMLDLAEGVMDLKIPVVLVVPTTLSYSYLDAGSTVGDESRASPDDSDAAADGDGTDREAVEDAVTDQGGDREALFVGLGDAVIPTILVASAAYFLDAGAIDVPGIALTVPALGALLGTLAGLLVLMYMVLKGRPHAGLPLLNGGAIGGYLIGALASGLSLATALGL